MDKPDYILDLSSLSKADDRQPPATPDPTASASHPHDTTNASQPPPQRPWLAVHWKCCQAYSRIYRNKAGTAYEGRCPKCGSPVRAAIGQSGVSSRFFEAS